MYIYDLSCNCYLDLFVLADWTDLVESYRIQLDPFGRNSGCLTCSNH